MHKIKARSLSKLLQTINVILCMNHDHAVGTVYNLNVGFEYMCITCTGKNMGYIVHAESV